jgi:hypothetical protein
MKRGRPTKKYVNSLRKPTASDYNRLVQTCVEAIIEGENDILVSFSYLTTFPTGFPKGITAGTCGAVVTRKIKARKLLTWLNTSGYTEISVEGLKKQREALSKFEFSLTENVELWLDEHQIFSDNDFHTETTKEGNET